MRLMAVSLDSASKGFLVRSPGKTLLLITLLISAERFGGKDENCPLRKIYPLFTHSYSSAFCRGNFCS